MAFDCEFAGGQLTVGGGVSYAVVVVVSMLMIGISNCLEGRRSFWCQGLSEGHRYTEMGFSIIDGEFWAVGD